MSRFTPLLVLVLVLALAACGAESSTPQTPTDAGTPTGDCPRTPLGRVDVDGGVCVYTCTGGTVACPGIGCVQTSGNPDHCGACGNRCTSNQMCDVMAGTAGRVYFCRNNP